MTVRLLHAQDAASDESECVELARNAVLFIRTIEQLAAADDVIDAMARPLGGFGFTSFFFIGLDPEQRFDVQVLAHRAPAEFVALYSRRNYIRFDPIVRLCRRSLLPFSWDERSYADDSDPRALEVMREAAAFGIRQGLVVPVHRPDGSKAAMAMAGSEVTLPSGAKPIIHVMALYAFERVQAIIGVRRTGRPVLTEREREVLTWVAHGKSAWEIAKILDIAKRTVDEHAQTAYRKLGAVNRTHAVAIALRERIFEA
jgi:LuxR family quorum sensing-dependent transcriptional regulator